MSPDIEEVNKLLKTEKIWNAAKHHMEKYHTMQNIETRVFSPTTYTVGEQRPLASDHKKQAGGSKRKSSESAGNGNGKKTVKKR